MTHAYLNDSGELILDDQGHLMTGAGPDDCCCDTCCSAENCEDDQDVLLVSCSEEVVVGSTFINEGTCYVVTAKGVSCDGSEISEPTSFGEDCDDCPSCCTAANCDDSQDTILIRCSTGATVGETFIHDGVCYQITSIGDDCDDSEVAEPGTFGEDCDGCPPCCLAENCDDDQDTLVFQCGSFSNGDVFKYGGVCYEVIDDSYPCSTATGELDRRVFPDCTTCDNTICYRIYPCNEGDFDCCTYGTGNDPPPIIIAYVGVLPIGSGIKINGKCYSVDAIVECTPDAQLVTSATTYTTCGGCTDAPSESGFCLNGAPSTVTIVFPTYDPGPGIGQKCPYIYGNSFELDIVGEGACSMSYYKQYVNDLNGTIWTHTMTATVELIGSTVFMSITHAKTAPGGVSVALIRFSGQVSCEAFSCAGAYLLNCATSINTCWPFPNSCEGDPTLII